MKTAERDVATIKGGEVLSVRGIAHSHGAMHTAHDTSVHLGHPQTNVGKTDVGTEPFFGNG